MKRGFVGVIMVGSVSCLLLSGCASSSAATPPALSDTPIHICQDNGIFPPLPGTLAAQINKQNTTQFVLGRSFQLLYTADDPQDQFHAEVQVMAVPYFDDALHWEDKSIEAITLTDQAASGATLTIPVSFPFAHPDMSGYTKAGLYCFQVEIAYVQPDGQNAVGVAYLGMDAKSA